MIKTSTLIYSIHGLASKASYNFTEANDFDGEREFDMVNKALGKVQLTDVRQEVVDNIMNLVDDLD
jgi:hypothetical protein